MPFRRRTDLEAEFRTHLEHEEAELRASGLSAEEAQRVARLKFGSRTATADRIEDRRPLQWLATLWQDVRYGARLLRRNPGFTATAAVVLSLGIGVNTALFSIVNGLFFKPLSVEKPEALFYLASRNANGEMWATIDPLAREFIEREAADLADFTGHWISSGNVSVGDETELANMEVVESDFFDFLGVPMAMGRPFRAAEDDRSNPELSIILSYAFWTRMFRADPNVIGGEVRIGDRYFRVIGVAREGFEGLSDPWRPVQCWVTAAQVNQNNFGQNRFASAASGPVGRLKTGATFERFQTFLTSRMPIYRQQVWDTYTPQARERFPNFLREMPYAAFRAVDTSFPSQPEAKLIPTAVLAALVAVVVLVLLIATANIAGLLLARGVNRTGEIAVRRALGARGTRLIRQLLTETTILAMLAGFVGTAVAAALIRVFAAASPAIMSRHLALDWRVLAFAVSVSLGTGVLVGLVPAWQAVRVDMLQALGAGIVGSRRVGGGVSRWILVPQVALSLVLLLVAAVHVRALSKIELKNLGYRTDHALVMRIGRWEPTIPYHRRSTLGQAEFDRLREEQAGRVRRFHRAVLDRVGNVPGVGPFALTGMLPLQVWSGEQSTVAARTAYESSDPTRGPGTRVAVSHDYFKTMGIRLLRGRTFDDRDRLYGPRVAVISEHLAVRLFAHRDPLGESVAVLPWGGDGKIEWLEVIGVVNETDPVIGGTGPRPMVYVSLLQEWMGSAYHLVAKSEGDPLALAKDIRAAVVGADPYAEATGAQTLDRMAAGLLFPRRAAAAVLATAGLIGLALAAIGLYGVVSYSTAQRLKELGIRATLGAAPRELIALLLREGTRVMAIGTAVGLVFAFIALHLTRANYPDLPALDVVSFVLVPLTLVAVVLTACFVPARRASRMDPAKVLRGE